MSFVSSLLWVAAKLGRDIAKHLLVSSEPLDHGPGDHRWRMKEIRFETVVIEPRRGSVDSLA